MDPVNPSHYQADVRARTRGGYVRIECADVIDALDIDHHTASAFEYIWRHKRKNGVEDLRKAKWRIERAIEAIERAEQKEITPLPFTGLAWKYCALCGTCNDNTKPIRSCWKCGTSL